MYGMDHMDIRTFFFTKKEKKKKKKELGDIRVYAASRA